MSACFQTEGGKGSQADLAPRSSINRPAVSLGSPAFQEAVAQHRTAAVAPTIIPCRCLGAKGSPGACSFVIGLFRTCLPFSFPPPPCCYCLGSKWPSRRKTLEMKLFLLHATSLPPLLPATPGSAITSNSQELLIWESGLVPGFPRMRSGPVHQTLLCWPHHHNSQHLLCTYCVQGTVLST